MSNLNLRTRPIDWASMIKTCKERMLEVSKRTTSIRDRCGAVEAVAREHLNVFGTPEWVVNAITTYRGALLDEMLRMELESHPHVRH